MSIHMAHQAGRREGRQYFRGRRNARYRSRHSVGTSERHRAMEGAAVRARLREDVASWNEGAPPTQSQLATRDSPHAPFSAKAASASTTYTSRGGGSAVAGLSYRSVHVVVQAVGH